MAFVKTVVFLCWFMIAVQSQQENPIKHLIILMMENRSFDHYLGFLKILNPEINGLNGNEYNCVIPGNTSSTCITVSPNGYNTGPDDPNHSFDGTSEEIYGYLKSTSEQGTPLQDGFVYNAYKENHDITNPMKMFTINNSSSHVLNTLAMEYGIFDNWFCSVPGPTTPNRAYAMSGTSNGMIEDYNGTQYNQQSYFDLLTKNNISWSGYYDATIWQLSYFQDLTKLPNSNYIHPLSQFYSDLKNDNLSSFIWLQPSSTTTSTYGPPNWQHPDASVELGETLIQTVYESIKNSSYWNETALIITYDEHGGFYDHVAPPQTGVPPPDGVKAPNGFEFNRLGVRIPTIVISPWINKGTVIHSAVGPTNTSQYEGTSNIATANNLFGLNEYLGNRHKWSATYDHLFLERDAPRVDAPEFIKPRSWTMDDLKFQAAKSMNTPLTNQVNFMCNHFKIEPCPVFNNQGEASEFLIELMPKYMSMIKSQK